MYHVDLHIANEKPKNHRPIFRGRLKTGNIVIGMFSCNLKDELTTELVNVQCICNLD